MCSGGRHPSGGCRELCIPALTFLVSGQGGRVHFMRLQTLSFLDGCSVDALGPPAVTLSQGVPPP